MLHTMKMPGDYDYPNWDGKRGTTEWKLLFSIAVLLGIPAAVWIVLSFWWALGAGAIVALGLYLDSREWSLG